MAMESQSSSPSYETLLSHLKHHNIRDWLIAGAKREDANTIRYAVGRLSDAQLKRRFARLLSK